MLSCSRIQPYPVRQQPSEPVPQQPSIYMTQQPVEPELQQSPVLLLQLSWVLCSNIIWASSTHWACVMAGPQMPATVMPQLLVPPTACLHAESCLCQQPVGNTSGFVGWRSTFFVTNLQSNFSNVLTFWVILLRSHSLTRPLVKPPSCPQNYLVHWAHLRPSKLGLWLHCCLNPRASAQGLWWFFLAL